MFNWLTLLPSILASLPAILQEIETLPTQVGDIAKLFQKHTATNPAPTTAQVVTGAVATITTIGRIANTVAAVVAPKQAPTIAADVAATEAVAGEAAAVAV